MNVVRMIVVFCCALSVALHGQGEGDVEPAFEAARRIAVIEGDLARALEEYRRLADRYRARPDVAARALLQIGELQEKAGWRDARRTYERIVTEYDRATAYASQARARLASLDAAGYPTPVLADRRVWDQAVGFWGTTTADGRFLSYPDFEKGEVAVRDLATGQSRTVTRHGESGVRQAEAQATAISPDGARVAFTWNRWDDAAAMEGQFELRVVQIDGRNEQVIFRGPTIVELEPQAWTPDGRFVLAVAVERRLPGSRVIKVAADGSATHTLATSDRPLERVRVSPDGRYAAFDRLPADASAPGEQREVLTVPLDPSNAAPVLIGRNASTIGWTPGGGLLINVVRNERREASLVPMREGRPIGVPIAVPQTREIESPLGVTTSGSLVYGVTLRPTENILVAIDDEGVIGERTVDRPVAAFGLGALGGGARFAPDGSALLYAGTQRAVVIRTLSDNGERTLVPQMTQMLRVEWAPDARSLLISGAAKPGPGIYRVDLATGAATLLVPGASIGAFAAASDGTVIYYRRADGVILAREMTGGTERPLIDGDMTIFDLRLRRDGLKLLAVGLRRLRTVDLPGGDVHVRYDAGAQGGQFYGGDWSPDGRSFFVSARLNELWRFASEDGEPLRAVVGANYRGISVSPDGRRLATTRWINTRQVWVLENFLPVTAAP